MKQIILYILILVIPFLAQLYITCIYNKNKQIQNKKVLSGFEVARKILDTHGLESMYIVEVKGVLSDHYDAKQKVIRLSTEVFHGESIAALAIASHECGHAIQDKEGYSMFKLRSFLSPVIQFITYSAYIFFLIGLFLQLVDFLFFAIGFVLISLLFQFITLPVELDASKRAMQAIEKENLGEDEEMEEVNKTLKAAAFTYIASILSSVLHLVRLIHLNRD